MPKVKKKKFLKNLWIAFAALCAIITNIAILGLKKPKISITIILIIALTTAFFMNVPQKIMTFVSNSFNTASTSLNLEVKSIYLEGRENENEQKIHEELKKETGTPILRTDLHAIRDRLEAMPWIKHAVVERLLPSTLSVHIVERKPAAIWQYQGKLKIIDEEGTAIDSQNIAAFSDLIILVGEDVPSYSGHLLAILRSDQSLANKIHSATRFGERRWNLRLKNNIEVFLPEEQSEKAWLLVSAMDREQKILDNKEIKSIDLRNKDKIYIEKKK